MYSFYVDDLHKANQDLGEDAHLILDNALTRNGIDFTRQLMLIRPQVLDII